jgi:hypothetical protein
MDKIIIKDLISSMGFEESSNYLNELIENNVLWTHLGKKEVRILGVKYWPRYSYNGGLEFIYEGNSEPVRHGAVMQVGTSSSIVDETTNMIVYYKERKKIVSPEDPYGEEDWSTDESMKHLKSFYKFNESIIKWHDKGEFGDEEEVDDEPVIKDHKFIILIGDWSSDGHGKSESFVLNGNYPVKMLRQAYKDSCKLTGVQFNHNYNYTGIRVYHLKKDMKKLKKDKFVLNMTMV